MRGRDGRGAGGQTRGEVSCLRFCSGKDFCDACVYGLQNHAVLEKKVDFDLKIFTHSAFCRALRAAEILKKANKHDVMFL